MALALQQTGQRWCWISPDLCACLTGTVYCFSASQKVDAASMSWISRISSASPGLFHAGGTAALTSTSAKVCLHFIPPRAAWGEMVDWNMLQLISSIIMAVTQEDIQSTALFASRVWCLMDRDTGRRKAKPLKSHEKSMCLLCWLEHNEKLCYRLNNCTFQVSNDWLHKH